MCCSSHRMEHSVPPARQRLVSGADVRATASASRICHFAHMECRPRIEGPYRLRLHMHRALLIMLLLTAHHAADPGRPARPRSRPALAATGAARGGTTSSATRVARRGERDRCRATSSCCAKPSSSSAHRHSSTTPPIVFGHRVPP